MALCPLRKLSRGRESLGVCGWPGCTPEPCPSHHGLEKAGNSLKCKAVHNVGLGAGIYCDLPRQVSGPWVQSLCSLRGWVPKVGPFFSSDVPGQVLRKAWEVMRRARQGTADLGLSSGWGLWSGYLPVSSSLLWPFWLPAWAPSSPGSVRILLLMNSSPGLRNMWG